MLLHRAGRLHVVGRIELERGDRGIDRLSPTAPSAASALRARTGVAPTPKNASRTSRQALAVRLRAGRQSDDRVVAVPPRQFGKADRLSLRSPPGRGWR